MGWKRREIRELSEFLASVDEKTNQWGLGRFRAPWFRGITNSAHKLVPSFYRLGAAIECENDYRHEFHLRAHPYLSEATYRPRSDWDWYFLMQHYGLPTRLLDWSGSALVALYFALFKPPAKGASVVWMMAPSEFNERVAKLTVGIPSFVHSDLNRYLHPVWSRKRLPKYPAAFEPSMNSRRITAQRGKFTIHGAETSPLEVYDAQMEGFLVKLVIADDVRRKIQRQLVSAGVTHSALFPDLAGISQEILDECRD